MSFPELLGHERIREQLRLATDRGTLHHGYLFEGPRGLGKRQVANWLAAYANCTSEGTRPCGVCQRCRTIQAGTHPDVIVLEPDPSKATATIRVDDVREVVRKAGYHRYDSERRFILIDPADAMQDAAANALLKTLEEPVDGTGFILIVSSASSLLPTIVSRCQRIRFGAVPTDRIQTWLAQRGHGEVAPLAARAALGCPGRALALAEGGLEERQEARQMLVQLTIRPQHEIFKLVEKATKSKRAEWRVTAQTWFETTEELLRDVNVHGSGAELPLLHGDAMDVVGHWTQRLYPNGVSRVAQALEEARDELAVQANGRLVLDAFIAKLRLELGPL